MISLDLLLAFGRDELAQFLWLMLLMDVPRYLVAAAVLAAIPHRQSAASDKFSVCGIVSCHNEEHAIAACVGSMRANGIDEIIVVNDGSDDRTHEVAAGLGVVLIDLAERIGKPNALNVALPSCDADLVLVADADTVFPAGALARIIPYFEPGVVGGVGFRLDVANEAFSLITRYQAVEYAITFTAGRRVADAFGILPNVSGAAGIFRRAALFDVGGWDCEVAEDVALAVKLRIRGWQLRYAPDAVALTAVPGNIIDLLMQRLRWDASVVTIWWFKHRALLNPFSARFTVSNLFTALDVLVFSALMPLILPVYLFWLWTRIESNALILLGAVMIALALVAAAILLLVRIPLRLLAYVPFYIVVETFIMRPLRVIALVGELVFSITRYESYIPRSQRDRLT